MQQAIHQECIDLLKETILLVQAPSALCSQDILIDCIDATREYNQNGLVSKASDTADLCWALLDYGKRIAASIISGVNTIAQQVIHYGGAVVEGGLQGLIIAGQDVVNHPAQFALCAIAGEYVLAYQLSKVAWKVLNLAATATVDPPQARATWDQYMAFINGLLDTITNHEITLHDAIKTGAALAVGWKAQSALLTGFNKLCWSVKTRTIEFIKNNPIVTPEQYLTTVDGKILCSGDSLNCPASCSNTYERLKNALRIEQFSVIVKRTKHGYERLIERRFEPQEVWDLLHKYHFLRSQTDGAKAYIREIKGVYSVIILNQETCELITALKGLKLKDINKLGKSYGWML